MAGRVLAAVVLVWLAAGGLWTHQVAYLVLAGGVGLAWLSVELDERRGRRIWNRRR